jgi:Putative auto-transporter adhesin, head GIN domain
MRKYITLLAALLIVFASCRYVTGKRIRGDGNVKTEQRSVGNFNSVSSRGSYNVYLSAGEPGVRIEAEDNLLPYIETYVDGNTLHVGTKQDYWLKPEREVKIYVSAPSFEKIHSFGSGDIRGESVLHNASKLELTVSGSANIKLDVDAPEIDAETNGSGDIYLAGNAKTWTGEIRGSGNIKAMDLKADETRVRIYGSGDADVFAGSKLDVKVAGSGDVRYKGNPQMSTSIAGSGKVTKVD